LESSETTAIPCRVRDAVLASFLPSEPVEEFVLRAALVSIVFTLTVGQNAAVLCRAWCDGQGAPASECHQTSAADGLSVTADEHCGEVVAAAAAALPEDVRRDMSSADSDQAISIPRHQLPQLTIDQRRRQESRREPSLEGRPLTTILRI
jgi:hypothetical protein